MVFHCCFDNCQSPAKQSGNKKSGTFILAHRHHCTLLSLQNQVMNGIKNNSAIATSKGFLQNCKSCAPKFFFAQQATTKRIMETDKRNLDVKRATSMNRREKKMSSRRKEVSVLIPIFL